MKYTVNIVMVIDNLESSFRKFHLKITIVCTKAKMVHFPFFLAPTGALVFNVYPY